jgi:hypothetical protein
MRKKILQLLMPKPNVPTTKKEKALSKLKILQQKTNASKAKLSQTQFELKNNKPLTFKSNKGKSESNREAYKRIQGENTKVIKGMLDKATEKKANGGRIGRRFGSPNPKKTNVQKIKETFSPKKKNLSPKQMKIAKLAGNPNKIDGADFKKLRNR